jgi:hypothetical protein
LIFTSLGLAQAPPAAKQQPLDKDQVMTLVTAGMDSAQLAKTVEQRGIDFEPTDDYLEALHKAGAQDVLIRALRPPKAEPMNQQQVLQLVAGGVPAERATALVKQRGVDFVPNEKYLETLRVAGADEALVAAVREAGGAIPGSLEVATAPNADVYVDGALAGRADSGGLLRVEKVKPGNHHVRISVATKHDFEQSVTVTPGSVEKISAALTDLPGTIVVNSTPGAEVFLDNASRGKVDASGKLVLSGMSPGSHTMRVTAPGKYDWNGDAPASAGQETQIQAQLQGSMGTLRVRATPGAKVYLDNKCVAVVYTKGEIMLVNLSTGFHPLKVLAPGEPEFRQAIAVTEGNETAVNATGKAGVKPFTGKGIDGLYIMEESSSGEKYWSCVRFFADGSVDWFNSKPSLAEAEKKAQDEKSQGTIFPYRMQGSSISFSTWGWGVTDHVAKIRGGTLRLDSADSDTRDYKEQIYESVSR